LQVASEGMRGIELDLDMLDAEIRLFGANS
jgi:hypothetical protein